MVYSSIHHGPKVVTFVAFDDVPVPADFDGDDKADLTVYRPNTGQWYIAQSTGGPRARTFGEVGQDISVPVPLAYRLGRSLNSKAAQRA